MPDDNGYAALALILGVACLWSSKANLRELRTKVARDASGDATYRWAWAFLILGSLFIGVAASLALGDL